MEYGRPQPQTPEDQKPLASMELPPLDAELMQLEKNKLDHLAKLIAKNTDLLGITPPEFVRDGSDESIHERQHEIKDVNAVQTVVGANSVASVLAQVTLPSPLNTVPQQAQPGVSTLPVQQMPPIITPAKPPTYRTAIRRGFAVGLVLFLLVLVLVQVL